MSTRGKNVETAASKTVDTVTSDRLFDDSILQRIQSFDDIRAAAHEAGYVIPTDIEIGTGFEVVDKEKLVGKRHFIIQWRWLESEEYSDRDGLSEFVVVTALTVDNERVVYTDGSTGVNAQLREVTANRIAKGDSSVPDQGLLMVPGGLRVSEYYYNKDTRETSDVMAPGFTKAKTYYLC